MVKHDKKSQFYLVATVIIIAIILGASIITNYVITREEPVKFYDLNEELKEESARVVNYGIYNSVNIPKLIENFTENYFIEYAEEKEEDIEFVFIYGSKKDVKIATYVNETLNIGRPEYGYDYVLFTDDDYDWRCLNETKSENIDFSNFNVLLQNCVMNGNIKLKDGMLRINGSTINGNIELINSEFKLTNSYVNTNTKITIQKKAGDKNILIAGNEINGNVDVDGGTLVIVDNDINGHLFIASPTVVVQASDNIVAVGGYTEIPGQAEAEEVEVNILDKVYKFYLKEGENFLFIITKETEEETFVKEG